MSKIAEKCCNPLIGIIIFLCVALLIILAAVIVLKLSKTSDGVVPEAQKLVASTEETMTTKTTKIPVKMSEKPARNVCESRECIWLAHQLHNYGDSKADPCQDFYKYTCGNFKEHTPIDGSRLSFKKQIVGRLIEDFLLKNETSSSKSENVLRMLYGKCEELKNPRVGDRKKGEIYRDLVDDIRKIGAWPMIDPKWDEKNFNLNHMLSTMASLFSLRFGLFRIVAINERIEIRPDPPLRMPLEELFRVT
ncbi:unnamed protein product [Caenorhabditis sp. 36 PRJEB53466]|nr:unnamed protein product [Caenorhabditis sp. 36 PRJEB53466]